MNKDISISKAFSEDWLKIQLAKGEHILDLRDFQLTEQDIAIILSHLENNYLVLRILALEPQQAKFHKILKRNQQQFSERPNHYTYIKLSVLTYAEKTPAQVGMSDDAVIKANLAKDPVISKDWQLLKSSACEDGYFGAAYINNKTRQIIIANRGTQPDDLKELIKDVITDARGVVFRVLDSQQPSALKFAKEIKKEFSKDYKISVTGHSLGGWLAQVVLYHLVEDGYATHAVTFDNPGARRMLESLLSNLQAERKVNLNQLDITVYLSAPNAINTCNPHLGSCYRLLTQFGEPGQHLNYFNYTLTAHDKAKILEQFEPETGQPKSCLKVEDWPHLDVSQLGKSSISLGHWLLSMLGTLVINVKQVAGQYNTYHQYGNKENNYDPVLAALSEYDQYYLRYQAHYKTLPFEPYELPLSQISAPALKFLKEYSELKYALNLKQCLMLSAGESIADLETLLAVNYRIEKQHKKRSLKLPSNKFFTASEFYQKLSLYLLSFPDLLDVKKFYGQRLQDMKIFIDRQEFDKLEQQLQKNQKAAYEQVTRLSLQQNQARLYLYAEPSTEEILHQETEQKSIKKQIMDYQQLQTKLHNYEQTLKSPDSKINRLKLQLTQQLDWLAIAEQYARAMICYQKRYYDNTANMIGAKQLLNNLITQLSAILSESFFELDKNQLISNAYNLLAKIARTEGQYSAAVEYYKQALHYQLEDPVLLSSLGAALNDQAKFEPQQEKAHLIAWGYHQKAEKLLPQITNKKIKSIIYANLGRGLQQLVESKQFTKDSPLESLEKAEYYLNKALDLNSENLTAYLFRGITYMEIQQLTGKDKQTMATQDFNAALKLQDDHPTALRRKALLLESSHHDEEALTLYKKARWSLENKPWLPKTEKEFWLKDILQHIAKITYRIECQQLSQHQTLAPVDSKRQQTLALYQYFFKTPVVISQKPDKENLLKMCKKIESGETSPLQIKVDAGAIQQSVDKDNWQPELIKHLCSWLSVAPNSSDSNQAPDSQYNIQPKL